MPARNVTKKLRDNVEKRPYKIITAEVKASFTKDSNKTITVGLVAEVNDTEVAEVTDYLFNECLEEVNRLLARVGHGG